MTGTASAPAPPGAAPAHAPAPADAAPAPRPADAARAALREAVSARRAARAQAPDEEATPTGPTGSASVDAPPGQPAESGDAQGASTRRPRETGAGQATALSPTDPAAADSTAPAPQGAEAPPTGRPGDAAREALRAALARRDAQAEREPHAAATGRRAADAPAKQRPDTPGTRLTGAATRPPGTPPSGAVDTPDTRPTGAAPRPTGTQPSRAADTPGARAADTSESRATDTRGARPTETLGTRPTGTPSSAAADTPGTRTGAATARPPGTPPPRAVGTSAGRGTGRPPVRPAGAPAVPSASAPSGPSAGTPGPRRAELGAEGEAGGPVGPWVPRSMAAPGRDGELRRTFPALPGRGPEEGGLAETWWGNAWVTALEEGALDSARLARGRGYAEAGHVDAITVTPGLVLAYVRGSRPRPYRVQVRLRTLDDADWDRFLDAAAERPGHIAALLDKEMHHSLADCGVPLLPGPGDLDPHCSCPDRGHPCKHAAALCYQTARLLDADPFVLLLLRGRGERALLDALSRRSATRAARDAQDKEAAPLPGVRAAGVLAPRRLPPLPAPLPPPPHPEQPPAYPAVPGGPDAFALDQLATDAAARAHALLTTGRDPVGGLTLWQDAVRLAAARPGSGLTAATRSLYASLASATGRTPADLARAVAAWRQGGLEGLAVLEETWDPPAGRFDRARPLLLAADLPAFRPRHNRLTHPRGHLQLRLGRDGLWYAYESEPGRDDWWPRGTPDLDPVGALTGLATPGDL
ncbi:SWIM zinc finger family protein [Streptomyces naganishii]|nr:SWIM zinc finger family protein [Streptomyces naganishii]